MHRRANIKGKINNIILVNFDMSPNLLIMPKNRIDRSEIISGQVTSPNMHGKQVRPVIYRYHPCT